MAHIHIIREIKEKLAYVSSVPPKEANDLYIRWDDKVAPQTYILPDGNEITFRDGINVLSFSFSYAVSLTKTTQELRECMEIIFNPSITGHIEAETNGGLPTLIAQSIARTPIDCRSRFWNTIVLEVRREGVFLRC
jgi:actin-related protein